MKRVNVRNLHLNTSAIVKEVAKGRVFVVEKNGTPIAELRPYKVSSRPRRFPEREAFLSKFPQVADSGPGISQDRDR